MNATTHKTKEEFAAILDGREYNSEITRDEAKEARAAGLLVIYGASDDLCEFAGAFRDEVGAPGMIFLHRGGVLSEHEDCECEHCGYESKTRRCASVIAMWGAGEASWTYRTDTPHATFRVMEDGELYCIGLVISISDLPEVTL